MDTDTDMDFMEVCDDFCDVCSKVYPCHERILCPYKHDICFECIRELIRDTMDNNRPRLSCPKESCNATITLDLLTDKIDPITIDLLSRQMQQCLEREHMETFEKLFLKFSCPECKKERFLDKEVIHFVCYGCRLELCCYCQQPWSSRVSHSECEILNYSGQKCFRETQELSDNWDKCEPVLSENNETIGVKTQTDVNLLSSEGKAIIKLFCETLRGNRVTAIQRIQNIKLWEKYVLNRKHMVDEIGLTNIKERALFHGTDASNIALICNEGFDMRVKTVNGAVYGKGNYFSTNSHYSKRYAGSSNQMFLARVLCGLSTRGSQEMTRPPKDHVTGRMYDSCVNDIHNPTIYVLFDNAQCYPAYIITYL